MIVVEADKEVNSNGLEGYRITNFIALKSNEVPKMYINNNKVYCVLVDPTPTHNSKQFNTVMHLYINNGSLKHSIDHVKLGSFYTKKEFDTIDTLLRLSAENLKECYMKIAKLKKNWNGKVTIQY